MFICYFLLCAETHLTFLCIFAYFLESIQPAATMKRLETSSTCANSSDISQRCALAGFKFAQHQQNWFLPLLSMLSWLSQSLLMGVFMRQTNFNGQYLVLSCLQ